MKTNQATCIERSRDENKETRMPYMYILECEEGKLYTGSTKFIDQRMMQHGNGQGSNFTQTNHAKKLVYIEEFSNIKDAFIREKQIQNWSRKKKLALIAGNIDKLHKLAECQNDSHADKKE